MELQNHPQGLLCLPSEIYAHVLEFLPCLFDIKALSETCQKLHDKIDGHLYARVVLHDPKYFKSLDAALKRRRQRAEFVHDIAIEYKKEARYQYHQFNRPTRPSDDLVSDDVALLGRFMNLRRLKYFSLWFDQSRVKSFTSLCSPSTPGFSQLVSCELSLSQPVPDEGSDDTTWGPWLTDLFLHPVLEILIIHELPCVKLIGFDDTRFGDKRRRNPTPLKELYLGIINVPPEFLLQILHAPKALERLEIGQWSTWKDPRMMDISLWADAARPQCNTLKRLAFAPIFRNSIRPLVLDDFTSLEYLNINDAYIFKESEKRQFHPNMSRVHPPNLRVLEILWRDRGGLQDSDDNDFFEKYEAEADLWPNLEHIVTIFDQCRLLIKRNQDLSQFSLNYIEPREHPYEFQDRSDRFEWPTSWYSPDSAEDRLNQEDTMKMHRGIPLN